MSETEPNSEQQETPNSGNSQITIALIGAIATIATALIAGIFGLLQVRGDRQAATVAPRPAATAQATAIVATETPLAAATAVRGFLFASQVSASGEALDPGNVFSADVQELYAVFRPDQLPAGLLLNVDNPRPDAYYYPLKVKADTSLRSVGWRWLHEGAVVNEFSMEVAPGDEIWLSLFDSDGVGGLFSEANGLPPGDYTVVLLQGGNRFVSTKLMIEDSP